MAKLARVADGVTTSYDEKGLATHYVYNSFNQLISLTDASGNKTKFVYDVLGQQTKNIQEFLENACIEDRTREFKFDGVCNLRRMIDRNGRGPYDLLENTTKRIDEGALGFPTGQKGTYTIGESPYGNRLCWTKDSKVVRKVLDAMRKAGFTDDEIIQRTPKKVHNRISLWPTHFPELDMHY